ncbi:MAG: biopolymer transport protein ExbB [Candidatus Omnitrophota bacterium]|jgi:biopolymer transport protein ExbB
MAHWSKWHRILSRKNHTGLFFSATVLIANLVQLFLMHSVGMAAEVDNIQPYVETAEKAQNGMTLWQTIQSGGWVMVVLMLMSIAMIALIMFLFQKLDAKKLLPESFTYDVIRHFGAQDNDLVRKLCNEDDNMISAIMLNSLDKSEQGPQVVRETIELGAKREIASLWQWTGYLSDIAAIAPMVGLLGTVIGMIQAFNTIAFQSAVVKPMLLAGGVSKAMVTTAAGMIIAIIAMGFYSFFRAKVQEITNIFETYVNDILNTTPIKAIKKKTASKS